MANLATDVRVAVTGSVYVAPTGTAAPTTSVSALNASFTDLGYISDDGVMVTPKDSATQIRAWQNAALVRTIRNQREWTIKFKLLQGKGAVAKLYYANTTVSSTATTNQYYLVPDSTIPDQRSFVFDVIDGSSHERIYVPVGEVTERGEVQYSNGDAIGREVTVTCYYNDAIGGPFKIFTDEDSWYYS